MRGPLTVVSGDSKAVSGPQREGDAYEMRSPFGVRGRGNPAPYSPNLFYFTLFHWSIQMTDYRASIKSKLAELDKERDRLLTTIVLLDEIDSESIREKISPKKHIATNGVTLADTIVGVMGERAITTNEIYERVVLKYKTSKKTMVASLYRMRTRGKVAGKDGRWRLPRSTASTEQQQRP